MGFEQYPRQPTISFWFGLILFSFVFFITIISLNIYNPAVVPNQLRVISLNKKINILFLGCDEVYSQDTKTNQNALWAGRSDTIILVHCNPFDNILNVLNIPRDTKIKIAGHGAEKINYLNSIGGPIIVKKSLEKLLRIHIDHFVVINLHGVNKIIDQLGGVVIDVPQRMEYHDYSAMMHIDLFPGKQLLTGEQAVGYVRFRHDNLGDIGRIQRQQVFMRAVIRKLLEPITFTKLPEIVSIYKKTILTDLKAKDIIRVANFARNVPQSKQNIVILPGVFGQYSYVSYWIPDQKEIDRIVRTFFYDEKKLKLAKFIHKLDTKEIKISIFNGSKRDRYLATKITNILRKYGYTILLVQDSEEHVTKSKIFAQKANTEVALQVKKDIGNLGELLIGNFGPPEADVTILAGDDLINFTKKRIARQRTDPPLAEKLRIE